MFDIHDHTMVTHDPQVSTMATVLEGLSPLLRKGAARRCSLPLRCAAGVVLIPNTPQMVQSVQLSVGTPCEVVYGNARTRIRIRSPRFITSA